LITKDLGSSVSIVTPRGQERLWNLPRLLCKECERHFPIAVAQGGREADRPPSYSTELKNQWNCTANLNAALLN